MADIKITIGITAYKCSKYLKKAIESVIIQNSNQWDGVLILDGGADKKTTKIFNLFEHAKFRKYAFKENQGPYGTRAKAIELSKTDWYFQLDGDDLLHPNAVKNIIETIKNNPSAEICIRGLGILFNQSDTNKKTYKRSGSPMFRAIICCCVSNKKIII